MKYLITLGCSWTWGAGAGYTSGMSDVDFKKIVFDKNIADTLSFRNILSEQYGYKNINMSIWRSSNRRQFRLARNFFSGASFNSIKQSGNEVIVLWGITSTGRNEWYSSMTKDYTSFLLSSDKHLSPVEKDMSEFMLRNVYDHNHEIFELAQEMNHWNSFFHALGIKNYWFDSFNHHDYTLDSPGLKPGSEFNYKNNTQINNFVIDHPTSRDLMSQLAMDSAFNNNIHGYHTSEWVKDTNRIDHLIANDLINPYSFHPTQLGHQKIAKQFGHLFNQ